MSVNRLAIRLCTVQALTNQTMAGGRVYDSQIRPVDEVAKEEPRPFIAVYTDDAAIPANGKNLAMESGTVDLVIEYAVATVVQAEVDGGVEVQVPDTDAGFEITLDLIERQIFRALMAGQSVWAEHWRRFSVELSSVTSKRGSESINGLRFAARQIKITLGLLAEPAFGQELSPTGAWSRLLADMRAQPVLSALANLLQSEIEAPDLHSWQKAQASLGATNEEGRSLGFPPAYPAGGGPDEAPPVDQITVDGFEINASTAAENP